MKWVIILVLFLAACTQTIEEEVLVNETNDTLTEPIPNLPEEEPSIPRCSDTDEFPCLKYQESTDEYNYCEVDADCTFAPKPSCSCSGPGYASKALNIEELERYNSEEEEYCLDLVLECPQYSPPGPGYIYYNHEARCVNNVCRTVRTGVLRVVGE